MNDHISDLEEEVKNLNTQLKQSLEDNATTKEEKQKLYDDYERNKDELERKLDMFQDELYDLQTNKYTYNEYKITVTPGEMGYDADFGYVGGDNFEYSNYNQICTSKPSCGDCISNNGCVWCPDEQLCVQGDGNGPHVDK